MKDYWSRKVEITKKADYKIVHAIYDFGLKKG